MRLQHPVTKDVFEVEEVHGLMLLAQGFYKEAKVAPKRKTKASTKKED